MWPGCIHYGEFEASIAAMCWLMMHIQPPLVPIQGQCSTSWHKAKPMRGKPHGYTQTVPISVYLFQNHPTTSQSCPEKIEINCFQNWLLLTLFCSLAIFSNTDLGGWSQVWGSREVWGRSYEKELPAQMNLVKNEVNLCPSKTCHLW